MSVRDLFPPPVAEMSKLGQLLVVLFVACVLFVIGRAHMGTETMSEENRDTVAAWRNTRFEDIERIELHPMDGGRRVQTIGASISITNKLSLHRIWDGLHSQHRRDHYLEGYNHWGTARFAKLEVHTPSGRSTSFYITWDDDVRACELSIMPRPDETKYKPIGFEKRASGALAETLDALVASNGVEWVACRGNWEKW